MRRHLFALVGVFFIATVTLSRAGSTEEHWQLYADKVFQVTLRYPGEWTRSPGYDDPRFEGGDGFFMLSASAGDSAEQVCRGSAEHHLQPYGSHPVIRRLKVQGRKACLVWPSNDQGAPGDAELVVEYPRPVEIAGDRYALFVLYADKNHILELIQTVRFISSTDRRE